MNKKPKHYDITCEYCGYVFETNLPQAGFCSNKCRQAAYRQRNAARLNPGGRKRGRPVKALPESRNGIS